MILHYKNIDVKSDTISFKKRVQYSDNFSFIPIKFLNSDLLIQTPYLFVPFNISNYDKKTDKKHIVLSFFDDDNNNNIFIEKLNELDTENIEPLTSVAEITLKLRSDEVKSENIREQILKNSPDENEDFFVVPRVVE